MAGVIRPSGAVPTTDTDDIEILEETDDENTPGQPPVPTPGQSADAVNSAYRRLSSHSPRIADRIKKEHSHGDNATPESTGKHAAADDDNNGKDKHAKHGHSAPERPLPIFHGLQPCYSLSVYHTHIKVCLD